MNWKWTAVVMCVSVASVLCGEAAPTNDKEKPQQMTKTHSHKRSTTMTISLTSSQFTHGSSIPSVYTCDGENISPPLTWSEVPEETQSLVLIMDDPDAPRGTWDHWVLFNLPANLRELSKDLKQLPPGTRVGKNSGGKSAYTGPCPPDREHRYFFKLYALDTQLDLPEGVSKTEVEEAIKGHILAQGELMGRYDRPKRD